ncbi:MAG: DUF429 domain-containing protein, partial [Acidimicrobiales bacterium]
MNPVEDRALPAYVAHADWSVERAKRQVAMARLDGDSYRVLFVRPAEQESTWGQGLRRALGVPDEEATLLAAFDFPIGLPRAYACKANIALFPTFLRKIGQEPWARFATAAGTPAEISLYRPFYPARPGGTRRVHLSEGLGLEAGQLRRVCDGRDAETLFWTLGGKQVGKAALSGWRLLTRAQERDHLALWPFDGPLRHLTSSCPTVAAESYPREYYRYVLPPDR